jgi:hypothetical protein
LRGDGFTVDTWNPAQQPEVPDDCAVLALIGPTQPFPPETNDVVRAWVGSGGRVIAAPSLAEVERRSQGGVVDLLTSFGMITEPGIVCEPLQSGSGGKVDGFDRCATLLIGEGGLSASHPLTEPLRRRGRRLFFALSPAFQRGGLASGKVLLDLVTTSPDAWLDLPSPEGDYDYAFDYRREGRRERKRLCMLAELSTPASVDGPAPRKGRVLGIASAGFLSDGQLDVNRDFLVSAFNWMSDREQRVGVSPLPRGSSQLDLARSSALPVLSWSLYLGMPGTCVLVGVFLAWRRRS